MNWWVPVVLLAIAAACYLVEKRAMVRHAALEALLVKMSRDASLGAAEYLMRLATVSAGVSTLTRDLVRIDLNAKQANEEIARVGASVALLPGAMDAIRGAITAALQKVEEHEVPLELAESHRGAFTRVQRVREQMAAAEESSWQQFLQSLNREA